MVGTLISWLISRCLYDLIEHKVGKRYNWLWWPSPRASECHKVIYAAIRWPALCSLFSLVPCSSIPKAGSSLLWCSVKDTVTCHLVLVTSLISMKQLCWAVLLYLQSDCLILVLVAVWWPRSWTMSWPQNVQPRARFPKKSALWSGTWVVFLSSHCAGCKVLGRDHVVSVTDMKVSNPFHYGYKVNSYTKTADASCPLVPWWSGWLSY